MPDKRQILVVGNELNEQSIQHGFVRFFPQLFLLFRYIAENLPKIDQFIIFIPAGDLLHLLDNPMYHFPQVHAVHVYYQNENERKREMEHYQRDHPKLKFRLRRNLVGDLDNLGTNSSLAQSEASNRAYLQSLNSSFVQRMTFKRSATTLEHSIAPKRICTQASTGWIAPPGEPIAENHICPWCHLILRKPYQLACGHRICESCLPEQNEIQCLTCNDVSRRSECWPDKGFENDMQRMSIPCATCHRNVSVTSVREYHETTHLDESKQAVDICPHSQVHFHSYQINHLLQPTSATENRIESRTFSASRLPTDNANPFIIATNQIDASTSMLNSVVQYRMDLGQVRPAFADNTTNSGFQYQGDFMFTPIYADSIVRSTENTWLWKITHAQERISDARSERPKSIYSPVFYNTSFGYQMSVRLYLNGDCDTRGESISLFLVVVRGQYDAILPWPFSYKVTFSLIDQSMPNDSVQAVTRSFLPDRYCRSFRRPRSSMNEGYGFKSFAPVELVSSNSYHYLKDDTISIRVHFDPETLNREPPSASMTDWSPNDESRIGTIEGESH